jgi:hypothetical protein
MGHKVIDGSAEFMSKNAESLTFAMFVSEPFEQLLAAWIIFKKQDGSFGKCPLEMNVSDLFAAEAEFFAGGFLAYCGNHGGACR